MKRKRTEEEEKRIAVQNDKRLKAEIAHTIADFYGIDYASVYHTLVAVTYITKE